jgi:hypothetical protein
MPKMNLYLVLALALGAATPAPVVSPTCTVIATREMRAQRSVPFAVRRSRFSGARIDGNRPPVTGHHIVDAPLTGAATPRAPARA